MQSLQHFFQRYVVLLVLPLANKTFFSFFLIFAFQFECLLHMLKIIDYKIAWLNSKKTEKVFVSEEKKLYRIGSIGQY